MHRISFALIAAAVVAAGSRDAAAADMAVPYSPPQVVEALVTGGWYLRGDIGLGIEKGRFREPEFDNPPAGYSGRWHKQSLEDSTFFGLGIGYQFTPWLRGDLTGEYRGAVSMSAIGSQYGSFNNVTGRAYSHITGSVSSTVGLANLYADLGTHWGITPYVGAGIGFAYNRITGATQNNTIPSANGPVAVIGAYSDAGKFDFAWALHAGAAFDVSDRLKLDVGYRYLDMGTATTGYLYGLDNNGGRTRYPDKLSIPDFASHDFRIGMRYLLNAPAAPVPVIAKY